MLWNIGSLPLRSATTPLCLQAATLRQVPVIFALVQENREYLRTWLPWVDANQKPADTYHFLKSARNSTLSADRKDIFEIRYENQLVGLIDLHDYNPSQQSVDIGYWLAEAWQGRGIVSDACTLLIGYAFKKDKNLEKVFIRCALGNLKSRHVPERLGFEYIGFDTEKHIINGREHTMAVYCMERKHWKKNDTR